MHFKVFLFSIFLGLRITEALQSLNLSPEVQNLTDDYWNWRLKDLPQFATFEFTTMTPCWMTCLKEAFETRFEACQNFLKRANDLEPSLSEEADIVNLKVLKYELDTFIRSYHLKGFYLPVNCLEGPQEDLEKQFNWMPKNTYSDYETMITRLKAIPRQIDQIVDLMRAGMRIGVINSEISMKNLTDTIGKFTLENPEESPFYKFFKEGFPSNFTQEQIKTLQNASKEVISNFVTPAYEELLKFISTEYVTRKDIAITSIINGEEFYDHLIWFHTSSNLSAKEIQNIGFSEVERISKEMEKIIVELGHEGKSIQEFSNMIRDDPKNYYSNSEDLVDGFENIVYNIIPPHLPEIFKNIPKAELKVVPDPSPAAPSAFYISGAYDGSRPGVFIVNDYDPRSQPKYLMMTLSLHEGNPGHHLQGSHSIESPNFPYFRRVMEDRNYGMAPSRFPIYTYYVEGWGLYAEKLGFDMGLYDNPFDRYGHYSWEIFRACRLVVDTGMHALGWTREEAVEYMFNNTASSRIEIENEIDRYITWPGQALAYKIGELTLSKLRTKAEEEMGNRFDIKDFHDVVLNSFGPMDLVEEDVQKWINATI
ncbi:hypothetical protein Anas_03157 [Armadillidium nasatum]|uniref:DUF885 domain-containing protein n=1 Tax=Armadillidium nasatum TaxID=96803 RepID=A0A5N5SU74_9CRUS|nr:hypothetical protein Anas_03157 [Armadillidium nasatum]